MSNTTVPLPAIRIRGRSFMALIVVPEPPFEAWLTALDQQMARSAGFFVDRPVVVNLSAMAEADDDPAQVLAALEARDLRIIGVEGVDMAALRGTPWFGATLAAPGREGKPDKFIDLPEAAAPTPPEPPPPEPVRRPSLLINRPVRSGQSIVFEEGDVTVIGPVSSGAEIIAGGSIHIYGTLRGRAVAGLLGGAEARIFCTRLAAELLAIDGLYRTADHWGHGLQGKPVQVWLDDKELRLAALE
ncbi:septum site-determining protein MinC [Acidiphilium sp. PA]|uniref:septum site-determining protein MinC n=1 Tax=Acidiphilium sp. PA TaxID=2871705 RepID=UPI002242EAB6|nr:septum site-determining protein MinC [Acidiphilium sp. PA]MCW8305440.1 septum site-determining protein MinC [Acidiphilium sp. PA]